LKLLQRGDPTAAKPLWDAYFSRLVALARARIKAAHCGMADEQDVALSAINSFFDGAVAGRFPRLNNRDDLWQILFVITTRKAIGLVRHETCAIRGGGHVGSLTGESGDEESAPATAQPTPEEIAEVSEQCDRLLELLGSANLRNVAVWKMEGYTNAEIGAKLGRSVATVERKLAAIRTIWRREAK
jgi:DNA-directed RNA polymerase specialized sigma24 family protein